MFAQQPMLSFGTSGYSNLFEEYYVYNKLRILLKAKPLKQGSLLDSQFSIKNRRCTTKVSFQFPWRRCLFQMKAQNTDKYNFLADIGQIQIGPYNPSFFFNFKFASSLRVSSLRVGSFLQGETFSDQCRIVKQENLYGFQRRFCFHYQAWNFVLLQQIFNTIKKPIKNDFQLKFTCNDNKTEFYLQHISGEKTNCNIGKYLNYSIGQLTATVLHNFNNKLNLGMEVNLLKRGNFSLAGDAQITQHLNVLAKIDNNLEFNFAFRKRFNERFTLSTSGATQLKDRGKSGKYNFGMQLEFNLE